MEEYVKQFLEYLEIERNYSQNTIDSYGRDLQDFRKFLLGVGGSLQSIGEIDHLTIRSYLADMQERKLARSTVLRRLSSLRSLFKYLCRRGYLEADPTATLATPKVRRKLPEFLELSEHTIALSTLDSIRMQTARDFLFSGDDFEKKLLVSQMQVLRVISHLARELGEEETNLKRKAWLDKLAVRYENYYQQVYARLSVSA